MYQIFTQKTKECDLYRQLFYFLSMNQAINAYFYISYTLINEQLLDLTLVLENPFDFFLPEVLNSVCSILYI